MNDRDLLTVLFEGSIRRRRWVVMLYIGVVVAMLPGLGRLRLDNSPEVFFVQDAETLQQYRDLEFHFGRDRMLRLVLRGEGLWTNAGLQWLADLERAASRPTEVMGAAGLAGFHQWHLDQWPPRDPAAWRRAVAADPLSLNAGLVDAEGEVATVLVALYKLSPEAERRTLQHLEALLGGAPPGIETAMTGLPVVSVALNDALIEFLTRILPPLTLVALLLTALALRRATHVLVPFVLVGVCQVVLFGAMGYVGATLNLVIIVIVPMLLVVTLATALHVLLCFRQIVHQGTVPGQATREAFRLKRRPVFWTGLTTCVAFGSLAFSPVPPVAALGLWSAFAFAFMTLATLTLLPVLLVILDHATAGTASQRWESWARRQGRRWAERSVRNRGRVLAVFGATALLLLGGVPLLQEEASVLSYFPAEHPVRATLTELQGKEIGALTADIVVRRHPDAQPFDSTEALARTAALAEALRAEPEVIGAVSAGDLVDSAAAASASGGADGQRALEEIRADPDRNTMLSRFVTREADRTRLIMFIPMRSYDELQPLFDRSVALAQRYFPGAEVELTGRYPLVLAAQKALLRTMLLSMGVTLLCIALVFRLALGDMPVTVRALMPNLWPVVLVVGAMAWLGVPVDSTTVMIAAAVLGLVVDDSLHTLGYFKAFSEGMGAEEAAAATLERTAGAHMLTSAVLAAGFGLCALAALIPIARFGALTAAAIVMALVADLSLMPALLGRRSRSGAGPKPP